VYASMLPCRVPPVVILDSRERHLSHTFPYAYASQSYIPPQDCIVHAANPPFSPPLLTPSVSCRPLFSPREPGSAPFLPTTWPKSDCRSSPIFQNLAPPFEGGRSLVIANQTVIDVKPIHLKELWSFSHFASRPPPLPLANGHFPFHFLLDVWDTSQLETTNTSCFVVRHERSLYAFATHRFLVAPSPGLCGKTDGHLSQSLPKLIVDGSSIRARRFPLPFAHFFAVDTHHQRHRFMHDFFSSSISSSFVLLFFLSL